MSEYLPYWLFRLGKKSSCAFNKHSSYFACLGIPTVRFPPPFPFFTCTYLPLIRCFQPNSTFKVDLETLLDLQTVPSTVAADWSPERFPLLFSASLRRSILSSKFGLWVQNAIKANRSHIAFNPRSLKWDSFILPTARPSIYKTNENNTLKPQGAICLYYEERVDS